ncbi:MAG: hypothetical protein ACP5EK_02075 [Thermoplasmatota archaeon]
MAEKEFDVARANFEINKTIQNVVEGELPDLKKRVKELCSEMQQAKRIVYVFSVALFAVGLFFLVGALTLALGVWQLGDMAAEVLATLGFGGAGATSFVSLMLLHPMEKVQRVNSDASQAEMVFHDWHLGILLYIRAMDANDRESIKEAARNIREHTESAIALLEHYTEGQPVELD